MLMSDTTVTTLKPCPYCHSKRVSLRSRVECNVCPATGPSANTPEEAARLWTYYAM